MADTGAALRRKLPEIAIEAAMVMFAVFAAFGVEEWRETRQLRQFAVVARSAVETELAENLAEFRTTRPLLAALTAQLGAQLEQAHRVVREGRSDSDVRLEIDLRLPRASTAAWRVAQASQAAPYFDYDWLIRVSRIYELYDGYAGVRRQVVDDLGRILARRGEEMTSAEFVEVVEPLNGNLGMLSLLHGEVQSGLESLAE